MTTPRDDIAGLSERLRDGYAYKRPFPLNRIDQGPVVAPAYAIHDHDLRELLSELDALLKERDALQARVKELEDGRNFWKSERDRIKAFLSEGDWQTVKSEQAWRNRALRAEQERNQALACCDSYVNENQQLHDRMEKAQQERDEAYERLKNHLDHLDGGLKLLLAAVKADDPKEEIAWRVEEEMVQAHLIRRLAGPEKEGK